MTVGKTILAAANDDATELPAVGLLDKFFAAIERVLKVDHNTDDAQDDAIVKEVVDAALNQTASGLAGGLGDAIDKIAGEQTKEAATPMVETVGSTAVGLASLGLRAVVEMFKANKQAAQKPKKEPSQKQLAKAEAKAQRKRAKDAGKQVVAEEADEKAKRGPETVGEQAAALREKIKKLKSLSDTDKQRTALEAEIAADRKKLAELKEAKAQEKSEHSPEALAAAKVEQAAKEQATRHARVKKAIAIRTAFDLIGGRVRDLTVGQAALTLTTWALSGGKLALDATAATTSGTMLGGILAGIVGLPAAGVTASIVASVFVLAAVGVAANKVVHKVTGQDGPLKPLVDYAVTCALHGGEENKEKRMVALQRMFKRYHRIGRNVLRLVAKPKPEAAPVATVAPRAKLAAAVAAL